MRHFLTFSMSASMQSRLHSPRSPAVSLTLSMPLPPLVRPADITRLYAWARSCKSAHHDLGHASNASRHATCMRMVRHLHDPDAEQIDQNMQDCRYLRPW